MMKKIFLMMSLCGYFLVSNSQILKQDLPQYFIQNGDTIGIILSVDQVQKLDNDVELLNLFQVLSIKCDSLDKHYVKVINDLNEVIVLKQISIVNLTTQNNTLNSEINKLKSALVNKQNQFNLCEEQRKNDSISIALLKKDLGSSKLKNVVAWSSTGFTTLIAVILGIILVVK